jgi:dTDP-glucose pyrophosphorylase
VPRRCGARLRWSIRHIRGDGLPDAFIVGRDFVGDDRVALILLDNIFYGHGLPEQLGKAVGRMRSATVFGYMVNSWFLDNRAWWEAILPRGYKPERIGTIV